MIATPPDAKIDLPVSDRDPVAAVRTVVASFRNSTDAEDAVRRLIRRGLAVQCISIIGRDFETHADVQGFFHPADAVRDGAEGGAWVGGIFGLFMGAIGFFVFPLAGLQIILGPLAAMVGGAIGGAGAGALLKGLAVAGIPEDQARQYQERLKAGEFLIVVHCGTGEAEAAREALRDTSHTSIQTHTIDLRLADKAVAGASSA